MEVEQFHPTRDTAATPPAKPGWGGVPHLGPELLTSLFTARPLVPDAHYKLLLENRSVWSSQHSHHLSEETPSGRGEGAK